MNEVQLLPTVLSYDGENQPDYYLYCFFCSFINIRPSFSKDDKRVGLKDGKFLLSPSQEELKTSELDLVVAATKDAVFMVGRNLRII